ncbi:MAG: hypothetical protein A2017_08380 [Lentisphaerae bacterium GWF2_44_16]|nr:MAG: hypothetical protein A2017_08380 [Lentisphaerae bacterium GWF2_44_16]
MNGKKYKVKKLSLPQLAIPLTLFIITFASWFYISFVYKIPAKVQRTYPVMGTMAELTLYGAKADAEKAADIVQDTFLEVEKVCNIFNPDSEISMLNKTAYEKPFKCGELLWDLLMQSKRFYTLSGGSFDITVKPLMELWGFYRKAGKLPSEKEISETLEKVGLDKVIFDEKLHTVKFTRPGLSFDLGGIAKGYAVDKAAEAVKKLGIKSGIINLAGNMYCFPVPPPGKKEFTIGIRNPLKKEEICGKIDLLGTSISTSGNYERYVIIDGIRYTHIMDVKKGKPVSDILSVTVITPLALDADVISTSVFINGESFAREICSRYPATSILIIRHPPGKMEGTEIIKIGGVWGDIKL